MAILLKEPVIEKKRKSYFLDDECVKLIEEIKIRSKRKSYNDTIKAMARLSRKQLNKELSK